MNKLIKTAKTLDSINKVFQVIAVIGVVASIVAAIMLGAGLLMNIDPNILGEMEYSISLGAHTFQLSEDAPLSVESTMLAGLANVLVSMPSLVIVYLFLKTVSAILAPMKEGKPFHDAASKNLKKLGIFSAVMCLLDGIEAFAASAVTLAVYPVQEIFGDYVTSIDFIGVFNLDYLLVAGVCFLLSYIFSYGAELQKQSDETL